MGIDGIILYVLRAARFALVVGAVCAAGRLAYLRLKKRKIGWKRETLNLLFVGYLAALAEIIALRGGAGGTRELRLVPLETTIGSWTTGLWPFIYNLVGNLIWFVPLGMFLSRKKPWHALAIGAGVSLFLEILQWLLMTGITDVDDVIINALGALLGYIIAKKFRR